MTIGTRRATSATRTPAHHPCPRGQDRERIRSTHPRPAHAERQHQPGAEARRAHLLVRAGAGHARRAARGAPFRSAPTPTHFDIDASTRASRRAPARRARRFSYYEAKAILLAVCARCNVIGMTWWRCAAVRRAGPAHGLHGVRLILDTVGAVFRRAPSWVDARPRRGFPAAAASSC